MKAQFKAKEIETILGCTLGLKLVNHQTETTTSKEIAAGLTTASPSPASQCDTGGLQNNVDDRTNPHMLFYF